MFTVTLDLVSYRIEPNVGVFSFLNCHAHISSPFHPFQYFILMLGTVPEGSPASLSFSAVLSWTLIECSRSFPGESCPPWTPWCSAHNFHVSIQALSPHDHLSSPCAQTTFSVLGEFSSGRPSQMITLIPSFGEFSHKSWSLMPSPASSLPLVGSLSCSPAQVCGNSTWGPLETLSWAQPTSAN